MDTLKIIKADLSHIFLLHNLGELTFYDSFAKDNEPQNILDYINSAFSLSQIEKDLREEGSTFLIAYVNETPAGYARLRSPLNPPKELSSKKNIELHRIYVKQSLIGTGIGKALMEKCLSLANEQGNEVMWLGVWEHNPNAISFYEKWGFEKFSKHKFKLGNEIQTDILMKKNLNV